LILAVIEASIKHYYCVRERENNSVVKINENKEEMDWERDRSNTFAKFILAE